MGDSADNVLGGCDEMFNWNVPGWVLFIINLIGFILKELRGLPTIIRVMPGYSFGQVKFHGVMNYTMCNLTALNETFQGLTESLKIPIDGGMDRYFGQDYSE